MIQFAQPIFKNCSRRRATLKIIMMMTALIIIPLSSSYAAKKPTIHSVIIVQDTLMALPHCLHYRVPTRFCLWRSYLGIVNTTPVLDHYLPDIVVSVFNQATDNPWIEDKVLLDTVGESIEQQVVSVTTGIHANQVSGGNHTLSNPHEQSVHFKEADVIGNPALLLLPDYALLASTATPYRPYFQSMWDSMLWRGIPPMALPEEAMAITTHLFHHIGVGLNDWGGLYPHEGKVIGDNDVKTAAVTALRAVDIVTNTTLTGHVSQLLSSDCGKQCKVSPIQENSSDTYFQMIYPIEQQDCHVLGSDDFYRPSMLQSDHRYIWVVWRHYQGCADGNGTYIGTL